MSEQVIHYNQPNALKYHFELHDADDQLVGEIDYSGLVHTKARARFDDEEWEFSRKGIIRDTVFVSADGQEVAVYKKPLIGAGSVIIHDETYSFKSNGIGMKSRYAWSDAEGNKIVTYTNGGFIHSKGDIVVADEVRNTERSLLVPLGIFLGLNNDDDTSSAGVAAVG